MDDCIATPGSKEAVRAWLHERRGALQPPPAPASLRHLFGGTVRPAADPAYGAGPRPDTALACAGLAIARSDGLGAITIARLAMTMGVSRSNAYLRARNIPAVQQLVAEWYEREFNAAVVWRAHEEPPGAARLRRMFEGAAQWMAGDGAFSPLVDVPSSAGRLPGNIVTALEISKSRWRSMLLAELRAAQACGELAAIADCQALLHKLTALLLRLRQDALGGMEQEALVERACAWMDSLLARHSAPQRPVLPRAAGPALRPVCFQWPDWLMAGAPYGREAAS